MIKDLEPTGLSPRAKPISPEVIRSLGIVLFETTYDSLHEVGAGIKHLQVITDGSLTEPNPIPDVQENYQRLQQTFDKMIHAEQAYLVPDEALSLWELALKTNNVDPQTPTFSGELKGEAFTELEDILSHEVATPLTAVQGQSQRLSKAVGSDEVLDTVGRIGQNISELFKATDDLWDKWDRAQGMSTQATSTYVEVVFNRHQIANTTP